MDDRPANVAAALARLEAGDTTHGAPTGGLERELPTTPWVAISTWVREIGMRQGAYQAPPCTQLAKAFREYALAHRWPFDFVTHAQMGRGLKALGFKPAQTSAFRSYWIDGPTHRKLWASTPRVLRPRHAAKRKPLAPRPLAPLFWESLADGRRVGHAKPLVDTLGRVWPSARVAQTTLPRARQMHIQASANGRGGAAGCLWRYLTLEELARIPSLHRSGQVVDWAAWGRPVEERIGVRCTACGAVADDGPTPSPPGFPTHPPSESHGGGPSHITGQFSDGPTRIPAVFPDPLEALKSRVLAVLLNPKKPPRDRKKPPPAPPAPEPKPDFDPYDYEPHCSVPDTVPLSVPK